MGYGKEVIVLAARYRDEWEKVVRQRGEKRLEAADRAKTVFAEMGELLLLDAKNSARFLKSCKEALEAYDNRLTITVGWAERTRKAIAEAETK